MIQNEEILINGKIFTKTFSDKKVYIKDENNILYPIAYDLNLKKKYEESDILIK